MSCNLSSLERLDLQIEGVVRNVFRSCGDASFRIQCDQSLSLKQKESSRLICRIIRNADGIAVCYLVQRRFLAGLDAERLIVDLACVYQMSALLFVECVQVVDMLEVVRIQFT